MIVTVDSIFREIQCHGASMSLARRQLVEGSVKLRGEVVEDFGKVEVNEGDELTVMALDLHRWIFIGGKWVKQLDNSD